MATLIQYASGDILGATTFKSVETGTRALKDTLAVANNTNTTTSTVYNGNAEDFTIANLAVIEGIMLFCKQTTSTGTVKVVLSEDSGTTETRTVTVNASDLPTSPSWVFFKFGSTLTGDGGTDYAIGVQGSSAGNATFYRASSTAADWNHAVMNSTTATAAADDRLYIVGDYTGTGTSNSYTCTENDTASTDFKVINVGAKGILQSGTTSATAYTLKHSGDFNAWGDATVNIGTVGTEIPRDSTFNWIMDCTSNVEFGIWFNAGCTVVAQGLSRTAAKLIDRCLLNTDEAVNSTSLGVDTDTGWLDNDMIAVASTTRTSTQCEAGLLNGAAGASTLTVDGFAGAGGGLAFAHSGTSPTQAEVILLTRNVVIRGASTTNQGYVNIAATANVDFDWVEFKNLGSNTATKRGIDTACTTGTQTFNKCSFHDFIVSGSRGINMAGASGTGLSITDCVFWNIANEHIITVANTGTSVITNCIGMLNTTTNTNIFLFQDMGGTIDGITAAGCVQIAINLSEANLFGTISNITSHSNANDNVYVSGGWGTITNVTSWRSTTNCIQFPTVTSSLYNITVENLVAFGGGVQNVRVGNGVITLNNPILSGDSTFSTAAGISNQGNAGSCLVTVNSGSLGVVSGIKTAHTTADINLSGLYAVQMKLSNTLLASSAEVANQTSLPPTGFIACQKHDQTAGLHKTFRRNGTIIIDTAVSDGDGFSMKLTPLSATSKLDACGADCGFAVRVPNGQTCTPSVKVQEDGSYNGNRARLIVKRNDAAGISADTVLDTATAASDGAWETLTGTTVAVTDDCVLEFIVDCDGTAGNLYVDSFSHTLSGGYLDGTGDMKYWGNGFPFNGSTYPTPSGGGGFVPCLME